MVFTHRVIYILLTLTAPSLQCIPSFDDLPPPIIHRECLQKGVCQQGYLCGPFGCARMRKAHGVNSRVAYSEKDKPTDMTRNSKYKIINNYFFRCCENMLLPDQCLEKCSYSNYSKRTVASLFLQSSSCPIHALPVLHYCLSRHNDHRHCCAQAGVPTHCLLFCGRLPHNTHLNQTHFDCLDYLENMKGCFYNELRRDLPNIKIEHVFYDEKEGNLIDFATNFERKKGIFAYKHD